MSKSNKPTAVPTEDVMSRALSLKERPPRPGALSASLTFGWRSLLKTKYDPGQLVDVTAMPVVFLLMFTYLFGGALAGTTGDYLQFLLPGILVMSVTMVTMYTGVALSNDFSKGVNDRFRALPIWRPAVLVGALAADSIRYLLASAIIIILGLVLGYRPSGGLPGVLLAVALLLVFCFSLSWVWTSLGLLMRSEKSLMGISMLLLFPLSFASNIFVEPATMPSWLQTAVELNPISILVTAVRGSMQGTAVFGQILAVLLISFVLTALFSMVTMFLFRNKR